MEWSATKQREAHYVSSGFARVEGVDRAERIVWRLTLDKIVN